MVRKRDTERVSHLEFEVSSVPGTASVAEIAPWIGQQFWDMEWTLRQAAAFGEGD